MSRNRYGWALAGRNLQKDSAAEELKIARAARKAGLAGAVGQAIGGLGGSWLGTALSVTNPLLGATFAALGTGIGGVAGVEGLTSEATKAQLRPSGGKFHKASRSDLRESIKEDIGRGAIKAGVTAGTDLMGDKLFGDKLSVLKKRYGRDYGSDFMQDWPDLRSDWQDKMDELLQGGDLGGAKKHFRYGGQQDWWDK